VDVVDVWTGHRQVPLLQAFRLTNEGFATGWALPFELWQLDARPDFQGPSCSSLRHVALPGGLTREARSRCSCIVLMNGRQEDGCG